jgi:hypothetical protein
MDYAYRVSYDNIPDIVWTDLEVHQVSVGLCAPYPSPAPLCAFGLPALSRLGSVEEDYASCKNKLTTGSHAHTHPILLSLSRLSQFAIRL